MEITVVTFQKHRNAPLEAVEAEYLKRLSAYAKVKIEPIKRWKADSVLPDSLVRGRRVIGLFVDGKAYNSKGLAVRLQQLMNQGQSRLVLVIGAAEGMPARVSIQIEERWSLSPLTFSHQLARTLLLEVLYRSFDILAGGRYNK